MSIPWRQVDIWLLGVETNHAQEIDKASSR
jgi:hypothetical protein